MYKKLLIALLLIPLSVSAMDRRQSRLSNSQEEELADRAIALFFQDIQDDILKDVHKRIKDRFIELRNERAVTVEERAPIEAPPSVPSRRSVRRMNNRLTKRIEAVVIDTLKDYALDKQQSIDKLEAIAYKKDCQKNIAILVSVVSIFSSALIAIIPNLSN